MKRFIFGFILISILGVMLYFSVNFLNTPVYKIRFNANGGSKVASILVKEKQKIANLPVSTRDNYTFLGWYLGNEKFLEDLPITKDYLLEAKWELKDAPTYVISFDTLGGIPLKDIQLKEGEILKDLPVPLKEGYTFKYFMYQNKEVKEIVATKNMILVAFYQKNS